jgi:hypothetical protein
MGINQALRQALEPTYRFEEWLGARTVADPTAQTPFRHLLIDYRVWWPGCPDSDHERRSLLNRTQFGIRVARRFTRVGAGRNRAYLGIKLVSRCINAPACIFYGRL